MGTATVGLALDDGLAVCGVLLLTGGELVLIRGDESVACGVLLPTGGVDVSGVEGVFVSPQPTSTIKKLAARVILSLLILKSDSAFC